MFLIIMMMAMNYLRNPAYAVNMDSEDAHGTAPRASTTSSSRSESEDAHDDPPRAPMARYRDRFGNEFTAVRRSSDSVHGVRGGLALPADEAEPAETPMQSVEINALSSDGADIPKFVKVINSKFVKLKRGVTMDSGAGANVMPRRMVRNKAKIKPSPGSLKGVHYVAANDARIANEGEYNFEFRTVEGNQEEILFQIAEVNKALGSISYLVDRGYKITFDKDAKTGKDLSHMLHKESGTLSRFRRERNVWVLDAIVEVFEDEGNVDFRRQG